MFPGSNLGSWPFHCALEHHESVKKSELLLHVIVKSDLPPICILVFSSSLGRCFRFRDLLCSFQVTAILSKLALTAAFDLENDLEMTKQYRKWILHIWKHIKTYIIHRSYSYTNLWSFWVKMTLKPGSESEDDLETTTQYGKWFLRIRKHMKTYILHRSNSSTLNLWSFWAKMTLKTGFDLENDLETTK